MQLNKKLLAIIGKRIPAIYDVIPHGPQGGLARVALNPQPLPPHELGAAVADEFVRSAWVAERGGLDMKAVFSDLDDWCPTRPKIPKLPPWWGPFPPEPEPHPEWFVDYHLGFAARLSAIATGTRLDKTLDQVIDRSLTAIESVKL
ncbi:hypothetical protein EN836_04945 [Mesorhizobium sp. M1C.F.Ca.ET.193.01.1.1]|uniref:hypothetical protein n=1 Tax=unclassified Mesorhizobium TaxID=325217 RepID=UPI000FD5E892|nr:MULTISPECIES: hypothetical protein [unclassified Mesorhizobium]TGT03435.1 hypothetical protein EN820_20880 [bacterium M00.F.Ca.ET.177.01.1.1]TGQ56117.1 hypothetical protein EN853_04940 [Mesorhizobium sp. M1C.F.Ca.ET.210.01.1.1]TGQ75202.1 hypothetical protein EN855_004950 [Mesorhizobium sp. M1C.F.Ca.ET.212.01.1.1]TGR13614.1 hypothetical protein EN847_04945 [Mesorhizobium sp. M1C.F.Ca.ET.204.01.1.1]TGR33889.1 hypothetical protein EN839_04945 [Mesorhizobium sp. M1C.F.Ca.ET.196.01.1.1]